MGLGFDAAVEHTARRRWHHGGFVRVEHAGAVVIDRAFGGDPWGAAATPGRALRWACVSKLSLVVVTARLWQLGVVDPDLVVADVIPGFAAGGKGHVTVADLLTHSAGWRGDPALVLDEGMPWTTALDVVCAAEVDSRPSAPQASYTVQTAWFVLAELLSRRAATPAEALDEELGLRSLGVGASVRSNPDYSVPPERSYGGPRAYRPGRSCVGRLDEMLALGRALWPGNPAVDGFLSREVRAAVVRPWRVGLMDRVHAADTSWGLGLPVDGRLFGTRPSSTAFGHLGAPGTFVLFDPDLDLGIAAAFTGVRSEMHGSAVRAVMVDAVYDTVLGDV